MDSRMFTLWIWLPWFKRSDWKLQNSWPMVQVRVLTITIHWYGSLGAFTGGFWWYWAPGLKTWSTLCGWYDALKFRIERR